MQAIGYLSWLAVLSRIVVGQAAETKPAFKIVDVHVSPPTRDPFLRGPVIRSGRYEIRFATMLDLISKAYGVDSGTVLGGPTWLENDRFDVIAKAPEGLTLEAARPMLQRILAERFKLLVHNDTRSIPAYALRAGKHPQLEQADGSGETGCKLTPPRPPLLAGQHLPRCSHIRVTT